MNKYYITVRLHCPDGLDESLGFHLPKELDSFISWLNTFNKEKGYTFTLTRTKL